MLVVLCVWYVMQIFLIPAQDFCALSGVWDLCVGDDSFFWFCVVSV